MKLLNSITPMLSLYSKSTSCNKFPSPESITWREQFSVLFLNLGTFQSLAQNTHKKIDKTFFLAMLIPLIIWSANFWPIFIEHGGYWGFDTASYVDCARSIHAGRGFSTRTPYGITEQIWRPLFIYPPGYAILIAGIQLLGFTPLVAGVIISALSVAVFLILLLWVCWKIFQPLIATMMTALVAAMFPTVYWSSLCSSDALALAVSMGSICCILIWITRRHERSYWLMLSGFLGGILVCIRYSGMSLLVATALFLLCNLLWHNWQEVRHWLLQWLVGAIIGPCLLFARNLAVFGKVLPHNLQPMSMSSLNKAFSNQIISQSLWEMLLWYKWPPFAKIIFVATVVALFLYLAFICFQKRPREIRSLLNAQCNLFFLSLYVFIYLVTVTVASSGNFLWGAQGRFGLQVFWILWLFVSLFSYWFLSKLRMRQGGIGLIILVVLTILTGIHCWNSQGLARLLSSEGHRHRLDGSVVHYLKKNVPRHKVILSCRPSLITVDCDLNAQPFPRRTSSGTGGLKIHDIVQAGEKGLLWGMVIRGNEDKSDRGKGEGAKVIYELSDRGKEAKGIYKRLLLGDGTSDMEMVHKGIYGPAVPLVIANPEKYGFIRIRLDVPITILKYVGDVNKFTGSQHN
jgi:4-amino-4-deoxy-L-arabinose transferase-like glycosyltransferase